LVDNVDGAKLQSSKNEFYVLMDLRVRFHGCIATRGAIGEVLMDGAMQETRLTLVSLTRARTPTREVCVRKTKGSGRFERSNKIEANTVVDAIQSLVESQERGDTKQRSWTEEGPVLESNNVGEL
jgi:hypothetical protein